MTRLSLLMGVFLATTVTAIIILLSVTQNIANQTLLYRGTIIFFIFGFLGTFFGSFLEVMFMPVMDERETTKLRQEINGEDKDLQRELGDLLEESKVNLTKKSESGTPTDDDSRPGTAIDGSNSTVVS